MPEKAQYYLTGPIIGYNLLMPAASTSAAIFEQHFLSDNGITDEQLKVFQKNKIRGLRRKLRAFPQKAKYSFDGEDILMKFTLESGVYASVLIEEMFRQIG